MKSKFTKKLFGIIIFLCSIINAQVSFGQNWFSYFRGNLKADNVTVSSTAGSVGGAGVGVQGYVFGGNVSDATLQTFALNFAITNTPVQNRFKAQVGVPFEIQFDFRLAKFNNQPTILENIIVNSDNINGFKGKNNQPNISDENISIPKISSEALSTGFNKYIYKKSFVFNAGRMESWLVFRFTTQEGSIQQSFTMVLPFVVEGLYAPIGRDNPVPIKGFFKEPSIPQFILHNPPGDGSTVTFRTLQEACRTIGINTANEESNTGNVKVTLGIAGQAGMFITAPFEFSASITASVGTGSSVVRSNGQQNCLSITNDITTAMGVARANEGSIYMGYSSTIAYGTYPVVTISETLPRVVKLDSALMFGLVPGSATQFYSSKTEILNDIQTLQNIANNTTLPKAKFEALNQIKVWRQVLAKDSININKATNRVLRNSFDLIGRNGAICSSTTLSLATSDSYDVNYFLDASVGASFVLMFGGSGVEGGYEFKTKKTFGQSIGNTTNSATTVAYSLYDNDEGDSFKIKIVEDPTYGTPIFLVDDFLTKTSCPFEGGIQRDKPKLEIDGSTSPTITVSNVSLGTSGNFRVKVCNNANEIRDYDFGFVGESIVNDVSITSTAGIGSSPTGTTITKLAKISAVPANGCKNVTYDVNISRRNPASPMSYQNIEFVTYPECEPSIKSSIFANINFAGPTPPSNVAVSSTSICAGSGVTLSAICPSTTTPTWYTTPTGGFPLGTGSPYTLISSQFPTTTTTYYVGCETVNYQRDRVATSPVTIKPILTIQTFSST